MKSIIRFLLIALTLIGHAALTLAQEVSIPDPGLNAAIRDALQKPSSPLTQQDLLSLTNLNASSRNKSKSGGNILVFSWAHLPTAPVSQAARRPNMISRG